MQKVCHIRVKDEVYCTVNGLAPQDHEFIEDLLAIYKDGYRFMPAFKLGRWDGKIRLFDKGGRMYFRLLPMIEPYLTSWGYDIELHDERQPVPLIEGQIEEDWFTKKPDFEFNINLRPYQLNAVNAALAAGSGFIEAATGSGKTWMVAALADVLNQHDIRVLVIVPSNDLVAQTVSTFRVGRVDVGTYSGSKKDVAHMTVVATWQALQNNPTMMEMFKAVVVDEAHGATAFTIGELLNQHGRHIAYRWGFTGTIPKAKLDLLTLRGTIGDVLFKITAAELIALGYLAQLEIEPVQIIDSSLDPDQEFPDYAAEKTFLSKNPKRLEVLADLIIARAEEYGNTLVLVNSVKQGKALQKLIKDSVFLYGDDDADVRAEWYSMFEQRDDLIVIASLGIASTGISIDRVFNLMLVDIGKSFVRCIQSVGRGLRKGRDKEFVHVCDVHSNLKWSQKHWKERRKYYKEAGYPLLKIGKLSI